MQEKIQAEMIRRKIPLPKEIRDKKQQAAADLFFHEYVDTLHAKQRLAFDSPAQQLLMGGAAGPGKSHLLRVAGIAWALRIPRLRVYLFRRTWPDLKRNHMEGPSSFPVMLEKLTAQGLVRINYSDHEIKFFNGSSITLAHMQHEKDKENIQGAEIHLGLVDELTHFTKTQYAFIRARVRAVGLRLTEEYQRIFPRILCGSNPGSTGHNWVKALFIDPAPPGEIWMAPKEEGGLSTQFIPAFLADNPSMAKDDPEYHLRLQGLGNPDLVRAMLEGDWDVVAGGAIDDIWKKDIHVVPSFRIPFSWKIRRSFDWGSSKPFSVGWWAESDGTTAPNGKKYPPGTRFRIAEWYGWNGKPNEGLKMLAVDIAREIWRREQAMGYKVSPGPADPSIYAAENGVCIADDMANATIKEGDRTIKCGIRWEPADNAPGSRKTGLERVRSFLSASCQQPMEEPGLFIFENCRQWIRTVPVLPRDETKIDDVDTDAEDHIYDETRYELMGVRRDVQQKKLTGL